MQGAGCPMPGGSTACPDYSEDNVRLSCAEASQETEFIGVPRPSPYACARSVIPDDTGFSGGAGIPFNMKKIFPGQQ